MFRKQDIPTFIKLGVTLLTKQKIYSPIVASFDVTSKCTLHCKTCYWWLENRKTELSDEDYYQKVVEIKKLHPTLVAAIWMGGEPLLRKELVTKCMPLFSFNEVITNGTLELPFWPNVRFACSVDGTKKYHEAQRGLNTYEKIKNHINRNDLNINIICIVTKLNQECLEDFVEEWKKSKIKSIGFGFYTPIMGKKDNDDIWLNFQERDLVLDRLIRLKKKYPTFINSSLKFFENFKSDRCHKITERCRRDIAPFSGMCFSSSMRRKFPCVIGENAECEKCGCGGSVISESIQNGDYSAILQHIKAALHR